MAQTVLPNEPAGLISAPFPTPPGLETTAAASPALAVGITEDSAPQGSSSHMDTKSEREALANDVRRAVTAEVDAKVQDKMTDLWSRGKKLLNDIEQENQKKTTELLTSLSQCREKQESLIAEQEKLRSVLTNMVQQFSLLGAVFAGPAAAAAAAKGAPPTPGAASCLGGVLTANAPGSVASTTASGEGSSADGSGVQDSPMELPTGGNLGAPPLPALPDFPFAVPTPAVATPLSLAEALNSETPTNSTPLSLNDSIDESRKIFSFTLRKADGTDLGLNVSHMENDKVLLVEGVRPEGAVEAWNRQCEYGRTPEKAVMPGDRIVCVNGVMYDPIKMLEECRDRQLLKITVMRDREVPGVSAAAKAAAANVIPPFSTTTLRADASEFVPVLRADASEFVPTGMVIPAQAAKKDDSVKQMPVA